MNKSNKIINSISLIDNEIDSQNNTQLKEQMMDYQDLDDDGDSKLENKFDYDEFSRITDLSKYNYNNDTTYNYNNLNENFIENSIFNKDINYYNNKQIIPSTSELDNKPKPNNYKNSNIDKTIKPDQARKLNKNIDINYNLEDYELTEQNWKEEKQVAQNEAHEKKENRLLVFENYENTQDL